MSYKETDYYYIDLELGDLIYTERYLIEKGECCGTDCKHCPFEPNNKFGNHVVKKKFQHLKDIKDDKNIT